MEQLDVKELIEIISKDHNYSLPPRFTIVRLNSTQCPLCNKIYTNMRSLREHIRTVHNKEKVDCEYCTARLRSRRNLLGHYKQFHPTKPIPPPKPTSSFETLSDLPKLDDFEILEIE